LETNSEDVNVQNQEQTQDRAASAAEPGQASTPGEAGTPGGASTSGEEGEGAAVEATEEQAAADALSEDEEAVESAEPEDPIAVLEEALAQAQAQAEEYLDGWQRARAEFANYRRREEQRREQAIGEIAGRIVGHFLPVLDDLERAFSSVPPEVQDSPWVEGLSLVAQKMLNGMEKEGVAAIPIELGEPFDPNLHMAVLHLPCADYDEGQIAMVLQRGYKIGERVLRPAMVQVSSGKTCDDGGDEQAADPQDESAG
jgi:molecular chaperone GrpE